MDTRGANRLRTCSEVLSSSESDFETVEVLDSGFISPLAQARYREGVEAKKEESRTVVPGEYLDPNAVKHIISEGGAQFFKRAQLFEKNGQTHKAMTFYSRASDLGDMQAQYRLGMAWEAEGKLNDAMAIYYKAAQQGHSKAWLALGRLQTKQGLGLVDKKDYKKAINVLMQALFYYEKALNLNDINAVCPLGTLAMQVKWSLPEEVKNAFVGTKYVQPEKIEEWYQTGMAFQSVEAMYGLGVFCKEMFISNHPNKEEYRTKSIAAYTAAGNRGHVKAQYCSGVWCDSLGKQEEALEWYVKAANQNHFDAQVACAATFRSMHDKETSAELKSKYHQEMKVWYGTVAAKQHPEAMYQLAKILEGENNRRDAELYFQQAANLGHRYAILKMAAITQSIGNDEAALMWYACFAGHNDRSFVDAAKETGTAQQKHQLGEFFERLGDLRDVEAEPLVAGSTQKALHWYSQAASKKYIPAIFALGNLYMRMCNYVDALNIYGHLLAIVSLDYKMRAEVLYNCSRIYNFLAKQPSLPGHKIDRPFCLTQELFCLKAAAELGHTEAEGQVRLIENRPMTEEELAVVPGPVLITAQKQQETGELITSNDWERATDDLLEVFNSNQAGRELLRLSGLEEEFNQDQ
tara:strand:- start:101036 stop:102940 length:1905 start_codon:yes stop_codon:yes gene_type:complete